MPRQSRVPPLCPISAPDRGWGPAGSPLPHPGPPATALLLLLKTIETTKLACGWVIISHCYSAWLPRMTKGVVSPFYEPPDFQRQTWKSGFFWRFLLEAELPGGMAIVTVSSVTVGLRSRVITGWRELLSLGCLKQQLREDRG